MSQLKLAFGKAESQMPEDSKPERERILNLAKRRNAYVESPKRFGSGIRIGGGMVLTSWHIIRRETSWVKVDGKPARILHHRKRLDLCLLQGRPDTLPTISLRMPQQLDALFWIGNPLGYKNLCKPVSVMGLSRRHVYLSDSIPCGSSGAGVYSWDGSLAGMIDEDQGDPKDGMIPCAKPAWMLEAFIEESHGFFGLVG